MKNVIRVDFENQRIIMDRTFAKNAENTMSAEYAHLQSVRRDYPAYTVVRRKIKTNPNKECYKGLTYDYMENYISIHEKGENRDLVLADFTEMRLIAECHSKCKRYSTIKKWFLAKYPEVAKFGMPAAEENASETNEAPAAENSKVVDLPQQPEEAAA